MMSKEYLEALKIVKYNSSKEVVEAFDVIEKGLQRLEAIDNAEPSEALTEIFNIIYNLDCGTTYEQDKKLDECRKTIKQALLKAQEQEKVLNIIKEKEVNIASLKAYDLEEYNMIYENKLTEEEFDLLKEYLG